MKEKTQYLHDLNSPLREHVEKNISASRTCWIKFKSNQPLLVFQRVMGINKQILINESEKRQSEADTGTSTHCRCIFAQTGAHTFAHMNAHWCRVLTCMCKDGHSLVVSWSGTGEVADTHSGGIFAIKVGPVAIFPLTAQAKYQGTVQCCFAPLVELIRCSQRTALSSHCSAHNTASVALWRRQRAKIT